MKFMVRKSSDWEYKSEVEINTLEELLEFRNNVLADIILSRNCREGVESIEIYDSYRE